jgi:hypothetical protein
MSEKEFLTSLGFSANPFQFTNADEEDHLQSYFVPPPYFDSVWGDPNTPSSHVIFAPRGGGKSAQRRMIEYRAEKESIFTITYDRFEDLGSIGLKKITTEYHLANLIRLALLGFLLEFKERGLQAPSFRAAEREQIEMMCRTYIGDINRISATEAAKSLRTLSSKVKNTLKEWSGPLSSLVSLILKTKGLGPINLGPGHSDSSSVRLAGGPSKAHLEIMRDLLRTIGFRSLYVLVDKVDETPETGNNAMDSFDLIKPVIRDLELLQIPGIGFKFFLWDKLEGYYQEFARPDRIQQFTLSWEVKQINEMLAKRLIVFSSGRVKNISQLTDGNLAEPLQQLVVLFAFGSPRDMIRVCKEILAEQLRIDANSKRIGENAIIQGILKFSKQRARELAGEDTIRELMKVGRLDFTTSLIANRVFKISVNSARTKIMQWVQKGVVEKVDEDRTGGRPVHHYAVADIRIARAMIPEFDFVEFWWKKFEYCGNCRRVLIRDWDLRNTHTCHHCQTVHVQEPRPQE